MSLVVDYAKANAEVSRIGKEITTNSNPHGINLSALDNQQVRLCSNSNTSGMSITYDAAIIIVRELLRVFDIKVQYTEKGTIIR